jgi:5'-phosphate synthase pdxT subunit
MVNKINIGVIGIQGAISEHHASMRKALEETKNPGNVFIVRHKEDLKNIDAIILPGGESTTISRILFQSGLHNEILNLIETNNIPIMGTCAGCVLLAKELTHASDDVKLLKLIDMKVKRNAFGRQKNSFEQKISIDGLNNPYNAVFIRAPIIEKIWGKCKPLAKIDDEIVMVRQNNLLALSFHPELTEDLRIHKYFLEMI